MERGMKDSVRTWRTSRLEVFELFLPCNLDARVYRAYKNIMSHKYVEKRKKAEG